MFFFSISEVPSNDLLFILILTWIWNLNWVYIDFFHIILWIYTDRMLEPGKQCSTYSDKTYQVRWCVWHEEKKYTVHNRHNSAGNAEPKHIQNQPQSVRGHDSQINHLLKEAPHGSPDLFGSDFSYVDRNDHAEGTGPESGQGTTCQQHYHIIRPYDANPTCNDIHI